MYVVVAENRPSVVIIGDQTSDDSLVCDVMALYARPNLFHSVGWRLIKYHVEPIISPIFCCSLTKFDIILWLLCLQLSMTRFPLFLLICSSCQMQFCPFEPHQRHPQHWWLCEDLHTIIALQAEIWKWDYQGKFLLNFFDRFRLLVNTNTKTVRKIQ